MMKRILMGFTMLALVAGIGVTEANAEGTAPAMFFARVDVPETTPAVLVTLNSTGELMFCATQAELQDVGIVVDAVFGCELATVHDIDPADLVPAQASLRVAVSSTTSDS